MRPKKRHYDNRPDEGFQRDGFDDYNRDGNRGSNCNGDNDHFCFGGDRNENRDDDYSVNGCGRSEGYIGNFSKVRPKKSLGQHFLTDQAIAGKIVDSLQSDGNVLEIGPGMGVLTQYLLQKDNILLKVIEIDTESVQYLLEHFPKLAPNLYEADFLKMDLSKLFSGHHAKQSDNNDSNTNRPATTDDDNSISTFASADHTVATNNDIVSAIDDANADNATTADYDDSIMQSAGQPDTTKPFSDNTLDSLNADSYINAGISETALSGNTSKQFSVIGNFPYNISSQIFFKILDYIDSVPEIVCMLQKEFAERLAAPPGSKTYGILSVLLQTWYDIEYLFTVGEGSFLPPPKVKSAVIRLKRNNRTQLGCDSDLFKRIIKTTFNQRRKTIRNSIKPLQLELSPDTPFLDKRPEQLSVEDFILLSQTLQA